MDLDYYMIKDGSGISITMALKCVECGKTTKNLLQLYCECGGLVEVMKSRKLAIKKQKRRGADQG